MFWPIDAERAIYTAKLTLTVYRERESEFFINDLPVRSHLIIEMILVDRPCAMGV